MAPKKKKLNLTIAPEKRRRAETLAELDNRSVSSFFETLIDEAWTKRHTARTADEADRPYAAKTKPKGKQK